jgi:hypothetical protein
MTRLPRSARRAAVAALAFATTLTAGCQWLGSDGDSGGEPVDVDLAHLDSMLEEINRLTSEIVDTQGRLIRDCMEEAGHSVHDEYEAVMWGFQKDAMPDVDGGSLPWLIDREIAATWGFGVWASWDDMYGSEEHHEFESLVYGEEVTTFAMVDNSAFEALPDDEKFAWFVDYYGEERARMDQGFLVGDHSASGPSGLLGSVEPEGCMGEVTAALGLEPEFVPQPDFGDEAGTWSTYPTPPGLELLASGALDDEVRAARTSDDDFLTCLEGAGWDQWEFNEEGTLNARHYIELAYGMTPDPSQPGPEFSTAGVPEELPADVPTDAEGRQEWESRFALDIWGCVDQSGLEADAEQAWANAYGPELLALEEEIYAWQGDIRDLTLAAQDLLSA